MLTDLTFLEQFAAGDKVKMAKYITIFLKSAPMQMAAMENHIAENNLAGLRTAAHSLKPQLGYMGIKALEDLARIIEHHAAEGVAVENLPSQVAEFKATLTTAIAELQTKLQELI